MKETIHVNIGSMAFTLDEDAYRVLDRYFADIRSRLPEEDTETMADIESRVAEIFRERVSSPMRVISLEVVRATMGPDGVHRADFGEPRTPDRRHRQSCRETPLPLAQQPFDCRHLRRPGRLFRCRCDDDPVVDTAAGSLRRALDLGPTSSSGSSFPEEPLR